LEEGQNLILATFSRVIEGLAARLDANEMAAVMADLEVSRVEANCLLSLDPEFEAEV
jgi:hypothetical protein